MQRAPRTSAAALAAAAPDLVADAEAASVRGLSRDFRALLEARAATGDVTFAFPNGVEEKAHRCAAALRICARRAALRLPLAAAGSARAAWPFCPGRRAACRPRAVLTCARHPLRHPAGQRDHRAPQRILCSAAGTPCAGRVPHCCRGFRGARLCAVA
jgi:hypothetical protein